MFDLYVIYMCVHVHVELHQHHVFDHHAVERIMSIGFSDSLDGSSIKKI